MENKSLAGTKIILSMALHVKLLLLNIDLNILLRTYTLSAKT